MQRPTPNDRVKSVNLINHLTPERRRNKPSQANSVLTEESRQKSKMVHEFQKIETGVLVGKFFLFISILYSFSFRRSSIQCYRAMRPKVVVCEG